MSTQTKATLLATLAIAEAIRDLGEVPSSELFVRVMPYMTLEVYNSIIEVLKRAGVVEENSHRLRWVGPKE